MGLLASRAWKFSYHIPKIKFGVCFLIIFSHVLADFFFTRSPVSFFWPFEVSWSSGYSGWGDVLNTVLFQGVQDTGIIIGSVFSIILIRLIKTHRQTIFDFKARQKPLTKWGIEEFFCDEIKEVERKRANFLMRLRCIIWSYWPASVIDWDVTKRDRVNNCPCTQVIFIYGQKKSELTWELQFICNIIKFCILTRRM